MSGDMIPVGRKDWPRRGGGAAASPLCHARLAGSAGPGSGGSAFRRVSGGQDPVPAQVTGRPMGP